MPEMTQAQIERWKQDAINNRKEEIVSYVLKDAEKEKYFKYGNYYIVRWQWY